jgi:hypothetical protein
MGDRTWTGIKFSGTINSDVAEGLLAGLNDECNDCSSNIDMSKGVDHFTLEHLRDPHNQFSDDECNYATMEYIEAYCRDHHISYFKTWCAGGDYSSGMEIYNAIVDQTWQIADVDGEPAVGLRELIKAHAEGKIEDTIGFYQGFLDWEKNYPPLEIVE